MKNLLSMVAIAITITCFTFLNGVQAQLTDEVVAKQAAAEEEVQDWMNPDAAPTWMEEEMTELSEDQVMPEEYSETYVEEEMPVPQEPVIQ